MTDSASARADRSTSGGAGRIAWPSLIVAALVIAGAVYSFSPRQPPDFPETQVYPERLLVNGLARQDARLIAVGEQGQILIADDAQGPWRSAPVEPARGSTLTQVQFAGDGIALAVGHDGWIVRSSDGGESWREVMFDEGGSGDPLLGISGPYNDRLFAYGAFGLYLVSDDLGQTWTRQELVIGDAADAAAAAAENDPAADPYADANVDPNADPFADPFAAFEAEAFTGDRHINAMVQAGDGALIAVGERGLLLRSENNGDSWTELPEIYAGSLFGVLALPSKTLIAFGMRGHAFRSQDNGMSWAEVALPVSVSLFGGAVDADGNAVLVGAGSSLLKSSDDGVSFQQPVASARNSIADLVPLGADRWLTAGESGLLIKQSDANAAARQGSGQGDAP